MKYALQYLVAIVLFMGTASDQAVRAEVRQPEREAATKLSNEPAVTDDGLTHLKMLPRLQHLKFTDCPIGDAAVGHLEVLHNVEAIWLADTRISQSAEKRLRRVLPNCQVRLDR